MAAPRAVADFADLLTALTRELADQQSRLDEDWRRRLDEFAPLLEEARAAGLEQLLLDAAPPRLVLDEAEIETAFRFASGGERRWTLGVQPLGLGFSRRYAYSGYVTNSLQVRMRRISPAAEDAREPDTSQKKH